MSFVDERCHDARLLVPGCFEHDNLNVEGVKESLCTVGRRIDSVTLFQVISLVNSVSIPKNCQKNLFLQMVGI